MPIYFYQYNDLATQKYNIHQAQQKKKQDWIIE